MIYSERLVIENIEKHRGFYEADNPPPFLKRAEGSLVLEASVSSKKVVFGEGDFGKYIKNIKAGGDYYFLLSEHKEIEPEELLINLFKSQSFFDYSDELVCAIRDGRTENELLELKNTALENAKEFENEVHNNFKLYFGSLTCSITRIINSNYTLTLEFDEENGCSWPLLLNSKTDVIEIIGFNCWGNGIQNIIFKTIEGRIFELYFATS